MDFEVLKLIQHTGPLTLAAVILFIGMRLGRLWSKVESLLSRADERDERIAQLEQRVYALESRPGRSS